MILTICWRIMYLAWFTIDIVMSFKVNNFSEYGKSFIQNDKRTRKTQLKLIYSSVFFEQISIWYECRSWNFFSEVVASKETTLMRVWSFLLKRNNRSKSRSVKHKILTNITYSKSLYSSSKTYYEMKLFQVTKEGNKSRLYLEISQFEIRQSVRFDN